MRRSTSRSTVPARRSSKPAPEPARRTPSPPSSPAWSSRRAGRSTGSSWSRSPGPPPRSFGIGSGAHSACCWMRSGRVSARWPPRQDGAPAHLPVRRAPGPRSPRARRRLLAHEPAIDPRARELLAAWEDRAGDVDFALAARRLEGAMHDIDRANVFTIHGFCQRVLADLAFESGLSFGCEVGGDGGEAVAAAVRDFWRRRMYPSSTLLMRHAVENGFLPRALAGWVSRRRAKDRRRGRRGRPARAAAGNVRSNLGRCVRRGALAVGVAARAFPHGDSRRPLAEPPTLPDGAVEGRSRLARCTVLRGRAAPAGGGRGRPLRSRTALARVQAGLRGARQSAVRCVRPPGGRVRRAAHGVRPVAAVGTPGGAGGGPSVGAPPHPHRSDPRLGRPADRARPRARERGRGAPGGAGSAASSRARSSTSTRTPIRSRPESSAGSTRAPRNRRRQPRPSGRRARGHRPAANARARGRSSSSAIRSSPSTVSAAPTYSPISRPGAPRPGVFISTATGVPSRRWWRP